MPAGFGALARRRTARRPLSDRDQRATWQVLSVLLDYPDDGYVERLGAVRDAIGSLPGVVTRPLREFLDWGAGRTLAQLRTEYVETFDHARSGCLYLSYATHGDTRRRGVALVQFKQAFRRGGVELAADELPDHLCVVLAFGATADSGIAWQLLNDHRISIEMLKRALTERSSPWLPLVRALEATLPALSGDDEVALARLVEQGPPIEDVGLAAYGLDPRVNPVPDYVLDRLGARASGMAGAGVPGVSGPAGPGLADPAPSFPGSTIDVGAPR